MSKEVNVSAVKPDGMLHAQAGGLAAALAGRGVSDDLIAMKIKGLMNARSQQAAFNAKTGEWSYSKPMPDLGIRLGAVRLASTIRGAVDGLESGRPVLLINVDGDCTVSGGE